MAKVQISIDDNLLARADAFAKQRFISRSGLISYALSQALEQEDALNVLRDLSDGLRRCADAGLIDDDFKREVEYLASSFTVIAGGGN